MQRCRNRGFVPQHPSGDLGTTDDGAQFLDAPWDGVTAVPDGEGPAHHRVGVVATAEGAVVQAYCLVASGEGQRPGLQSRQVSSETLGGRLPCEPAELDAPDADAGKDAIGIGGLDACHEGDDQGDTTDEAADEGEDQSQPARTGRPRGALARARV